MNDSHSQHVAKSERAEERGFSLLVIRPGAIGDCLLAMPAIDWLIHRVRHASQDEDMHAEVWVPAPVVPLFCCVERVRSIASTGLDQLGIGDLAPPEPLVETLCSFDRILSWYGTNRAEFRASAEAINGHWRFLRALPPRENRTHAADYFAAQVGAPAGLPPSLVVEGDGVRHNRIAIHPFSGSKSKNWPLERYFALKKSLPAELAARTTFLAGPDEPLEGALRFDDLAAMARWLAGARLYIGNDSGISHLAAAAGVPSIVLFGPTDPAIWAPRGREVTCIRHEPIGDLTVEEVLMRTMEVLGKASKGMVSAS